MRIDPLLSKEECYFSLRPQPITDRTAEPSFRLGGNTVRHSICMRILPVLCAPKQEFQEGGSPVLEAVFGVSKSKFSDFHPDGETTLPLPLPQKAWKFHPEAVRSFPQDLCRTVLAHRGNLSLDKKRPHKCYAAPFYCLLIVCYRTASGNSHSNNQKPARTADLPFILNVPWGNTGPKKR